ncbi:MAG: HD domain-containing protein [Planctomycetota bacterium]
MPRKRFSVLRDPVHGDVYLTREELALLDTPEMQRLRGIRQLGTTYLVFPGAHHTRFEHSIGSLHMAQKMIDAINLNASIDPAVCIGITPEEARIIRIAALLHDITHIPFGHNIEDQTGLFKRHDLPQRFERMLSAETTVGRRLRELGMSDQILAVLCARSAGQRIPSYWVQIIADTICSDILDYLKRDAYYTGLNLYYDPRLISYFKIERETGTLYIDCAKNHLLREDILSEILRMLDARYYFSERVYYHHAKICAGALVARVAEYAIGSGAVKEEDFYDKTDDTLLEYLGRVYYTDAFVRERVKQFLDAFRSRRLPKRCAVFPLYANRDLQERLIKEYFVAASRARRIEKEKAMAAELALRSKQTSEIILYCPARHMQLKEAGIPVLLPNEPHPRPLSAFADRFPRLQDQTQAYRNLWKFYVLALSDDADVLRTAQTIAREQLEPAVDVFTIE